MTIAPKGKMKGKERGNKKKDASNYVLCRKVILLFGCFYSAINSGDT